MKLQFLGLTAQTSMSIRYSFPVRMALRHLCLSLPVRTLSWMDHTPVSYMDMVDLTLVSRHHPVYTQPRKLCIEGGSNVWLLIGACINQRPDLFGCAPAHIVVMDMLMFHKFTIGHAWTSDYGCSDKEEEFRWLIKYSPLHNVRRSWEQHPSQSHQYAPTMLLLQIMTTELFHYTH